MVKSWLPVPRMPMTDQLSTIVAAEAGTHIVRVAGVPVGVSRGLSPSMIKAGQNRPIGVEHTAGEIPFSAELITALYWPRASLRPQ